MTTFENLPLGRKLKETQAYLSSKGCLQKQKTLRHINVICITKYHVTYQMVSTPVAHVTHKPEASTAIGLTKVKF